VSLHPIRHAAKNERMIDNHRSLCAEQNISLHLNTMVAENRVLLGVINGLYQM
jgi:hypothetical protein